MLACFGSPKSDCISAARYDLWLSKLSKKTATAAPLLQSLPPTSKAFREHVKRAHLVAAQFLASDEPDPPDIFPVQYGWTYDELNKCYNPMTFPADVDPAPLEVLQMIRCGCCSEKPCQSARCSCFSAHVKCSVFCGCHGLCNNKDIDNENSYKDEEMDNHDN